MRGGPYYPKKLIIQYSLLIDSTAEKMNSWEWEQMGGSSWSKARNYNYISALNLKRSHFNWERQVIFALVTVTISYQDQILLQKITFRAIFTQTFPLTFSFCRLSPDRNCHRGWIYSYYLISVARIIDLKMQKTSWGTAGTGRHQIRSSLIGASDWPRQVTQASDWSDERMMG